MFTRLQAKHGRTPAPANEEDAAQLISLAKEINEASADKIDLDETVLRLLAHNASGEISPMAAMFGGMVGQEVRLRKCRRLLAAWAGLLAFTKPISGD